jgi:hypothetical protein
MDLKTEGQIQRFVSVLTRWPTYALEGDEDEEVTKLFHQRGIRRFENFPNSSALGAEDLTTGRRIHYPVE